METFVQSINARLLSIKRLICQYFDQSDWQELGLLTSSYDIINNHGRLLRSLSFGDDDYEGCVIQVLKIISDFDEDNVSIIENYLNEKYPDLSGEFISYKPSQRKITFAPVVFKIPDCVTDYNLVALMMPFSKEFDEVHLAIKEACEHVNLKCIRVDDIWEDSAIINDIFKLIFEARFVISDFSNKNPNVMYETGIAHTLGKEVIPIVQNNTDLPFDLQHHRALSYFPNREGLNDLKAKLSDKLAKSKKI